MTSSKSNDSSPAAWNIVSEKLQKDCKIYQIYEQHCKHPYTPREGTFYVIKTNNWVQSIALTPKKELILVEQYRFGTNSISLETPGGIIDPGENPIESAVRELQEETGFSGKNPRLIAECKPNPALMNNITYFVLIEDCEKLHETDWDPTEELTTRIVTISEAFKLAFEGKIDHSITLNSLFFLQKFFSPPHF